MGKVKLQTALLALFLTLIIKCSARQQPVFSTIGSKTIVQGNVYKFSASAGGLLPTQKLSVDFKLFGNDANGNYIEFNLIKQKISNEMKSFVFNTKNLGPGNYQLSSKVYDPVMKTSYTDSQALVFRKRLPSILISTDKAMYKASDLVNFRVFGFDSQTLPYNLASAVVSIYDAGDTKLKAFSNITFVKGKYENSIQLSDNPTLGNWRINVAAEGLSLDKAFEVQDYILPTYSVSIDLPSKVAVADVTFPVKVTAQYTFGQSVQGSATVTFSKTTYNWWNGGYSTQVIYQRSVEIDSESVTFEVNIATDLKISSAWGEVYDVGVEFTESLTKKTVSSATSVSVVQYSYSNVYSGPNSFTPNQTFSFQLSLRKFDGTPAPVGTVVTLTVTMSNYCFYDWRTGQYNCKNEKKVENHIVDSSGTVSMTFIPGTYDYMNIESSSPISERGYFYIYKQQSFQGMLELKVKTSSPKIGSPVDIGISTGSLTLQETYCQMISKGVMVGSNSVKFENQVGNLNFTPDFSFAPNTEVICYYYDDNGLIQSQRTTISLQNNLPNFLDLELSSSTVKPGTKLSLKVSSALKSTVSLNAIDQSALLLKSGQDFTKEDVFNGLNKYNNIENVNWWNLPYDESQFENINIFVMKRSLPYPQPPTTSTTITSTEPYTGTDETWPAPASPMEEPTTMVMPMATEEAMEAPAPEAPAMEEAPGMPAPAPNAPSAAAAPAPPRVRRNFNEVIVLPDVEIVKPKKFNNINDKFRGEATIRFTAPDSITSYIFSGVSMNEKHGMGIQTVKPALKVFLPFFILASLPNNIKRGEILMQDFIIFNYMSANQTVVVTVKRNDKQFIVVDPAFDKWQVTKNSYSQTFVSMPNKPSVFRIVIRAVVLGFIDIKIDAVGPLAGDSILKPLKIVPEGVPKTVTQSILFSKNDTSTTSSVSLSCTLSPSAVNDTTSAWATCVGDLMGDVLNNLESLIQMSYGCGEQNMLNFVPNIVALRYLASTAKLTDSLKSKAISYAEDGYQRELTYRRSDGSFSAFGNSDTSGSTWLTAYVIKSFLWAQDYIYIDSQVISNGLSYLMSKQNSDGSFREDGRVIHKDMQGGSSAGLAMTAYVSIVLSDNLGKYPEHTSARDKALAYIVANLDYNDVYALAISSYALYLGNHASFNSVYAKLLLKGIETSDQLRWEKPVANTQDQNCWWWYTQPRSNDVEITAYALQLIANIDLAKGAKIAKYLVSQKNAYGGYGSSQDTVVGLTALAFFSIKFNAISGVLDLQFAPNRGSSFNAQVNASNQMTLQTFDLDPLTRQLNVSSKVGSSGSALVSFSCKFYEVNEETSPRFEISHSFVRPCKEMLKSRICLNYIARTGDTESNMVLVRITLLSGYSYDNDNKIPSSIRKLETSDDDTKIVIYIDSLNANAQCFDIPSVRTNIVENLKQATIEVMDYYDTTKKAQAMYSAPENLVNCADLPAETTTPRSTTYTYTPTWWPTDEPTSPEPETSPETTGPETSPETTEPETSTIPETSPETTEPETSTVPETSPETTEPETSTMPETSPETTEPETSTIPETSPETTEPETSTMPETSPETTEPETSTVPETSPETTEPETSTMPETSPETTEPETSTMPETSPETTEPETSTIPETSPETTEPETSTIPETSPETTEPETSTVPETSPETTEPETSTMPETSPEATEPETSTIPETSPETTEPETSTIPETSPETTEPETSTIPETSPETTEPETSTMPETSPETTEPETSTVPETSPETTEPETSTMPETSPETTEPETSTMPETSPETTEPETSTIPETSPETTEPETSTVPNTSSETTGP